MESSYLHRFFNNLNFIIWSGLLLFIYNLFISNKNKVEFEIVSEYILLINYRIKKVNYYHLNNSFKKGKIKIDAEFLAVVSKKSGEICLAKDIPYFMYSYPYPLSKKFCRK